MTFPGPGAEIVRNEAGEPLGWDYPEFAPDYDPDSYLAGAEYDDEEYDEEYERDSDVSAE